MNTVVFPLQGNNLTLFINVKDQDGNVLELTGGDVDLKIERLGIDEFLQDGEIIDPAMGYCKFILLSNGALKYSGLFRARVVATVGNQTIPSEWFHFKVE